jgi:hypothetical protein
MKYIFALLVLSFMLTACAQTATNNNGLQIKTKVLPNWESGKRATYKVEVAGGVPPYQFRIDGSLPEGFALGPDGTIGESGVLPPGTSRYTYPPFSLVVTDSKGNTARQQLAITIVEPSIKINTQEARCTVNVKCDEPIATAEGGDAPYTFQSDSFAEGAPPMGMIVDVNGHILGTSRTAGNYNVGVCAKDLNGDSKCGKATVVVQLPAEETWTGPYSETETIRDCTNKNKGTLKWVIEFNKDSFTGTVEDTGTSATCGGENSDYSFEGTVTGTISGNEVTGVMEFSDQETTSEFTFTGSKEGDTITATYTGSSDMGNGVTDDYSGSFTLSKE